MSLVPFLNSSQGQSRFLRQDMYASRTNRHTVYGSRMMVLIGEILECGKVQYIGDTFHDVPCQI